MRAILINGKNPGVSEVEIPPGGRKKVLQHIGTLIGARRLFRIEVSAMDELWIDFKGAENSPDHGFVSDDIRYHGNGVMLSYDRHGKSTATDLPLDQMRQCYGFWTIGKPLMIGLSGAPGSDQLGQEIEHYLNESEVIIAAPDQFPAATLRPLNIA